MNQQQIDNVIQGYLKQALAGAAKENPKLDFKREWYKLDTVDGQQEFIADTSAIANTFGLDGYIIIGYDEKVKSFTSSPFIHSGLRDTSDIMNLISKSIDPIYTLNIFEVEYDGNALSVLHIPPSIGKPHVIRCYKKNGREEQHRIFVRKGTGKQFANRYDIELMYYDRKNIIPDYEVQGSFYKRQFRIFEEKQGGEVAYRIKVPLSIENTGRRTASIVQVKFGVTVGTGLNPDNILPLVKSWLASTLLLKSNHIEIVDIESTTYPSSSIYPLVKTILQYKAYLEVVDGSAITTTGERITLRMRMGTIGALSDE